MAQVIVSHGLDANRWANQFCRQPAWTRGAGMLGASGPRRVQILRNATRSSIVSAIEAAARTAGPGGEVIYSIGHGNAAAMGATAQLGPGSELTINQEILQADANGYYGSADGPTGRVRLSSSDQEINLAFRRIGTALAAARVARFTFLVCVLGRNRAFLRQIKAAWGDSIAVAGYTAYVTTTEYTMSGDSSYPRISLFLSHNAEGTSVVSGTNAEPNCFLELPDARHLVVV
jgi:hypothetical protein